MQPTQPTEIYAHRYFFSVDLKTFTEFRSYFLEFSIKTLEPCKYSTFGMINRYTVGLLFLQML